MSECLKCKELRLLLKREKDILDNLLSILDKYRQVIKSQDIQISLYDDYNDRLERIWSKQEEVKDNERI